MTRVGLISDTHGLLRPSARAFLTGCDHIVHAGDIGHAGILRELAEIAPVTAVRGNNDKGPWAEGLPCFEVLQIDALSLYILHDLAEIDIDPAAADFRIVVSGHSHQPFIREVGGVTYLNPGSAGPRRFKLPIAIGDLRISGAHFSSQWTELPD